MKTFTKTVSMILIAVMCLSLFASGAYAMGDFSLDGSGGGFSIGGNTSVGGNTSFGGNSFSTDGGFSLDSYVAPIQSDPEPVTPVQEEVKDVVKDDVKDDVSKDEDFDLNKDEKGDSKDEKDDNKDDDTPIFTKGGMLRSAPVVTGTDAWEFQSSPTSITVTSPTDVAITLKTGTGLDADSFKSLTYSTSGSGENRQAIPSSGFVVEANKITIRGSWLATLSAGKTYYFYGERTDELPMKLGYVAVNAGSTSDYGKFTVSPNKYTKYDKSSPEIAVKADTADRFNNFVQYAVIRQGTSSGGSYCSDYDITGDTLTIGKSFLNGLADGTYDIYGITSNGINVKLGSMTIKSSSEGGGNPANTWSLWPSYEYAWTSGDDPLMFRSNLMAKRQSYPSYTIVPRYGYGAGSIPNNMIDVNQFWDMGDGVFALGTNFLRSLPAGTYTLQVVDYKHLNDCTNVVTFKIGSTLRPIDTDKHVIGSIKNLRFLCDEPVYEVYVGNIPLTYGEDYALSNGNKTITLSFEFLNKRSAGNTYTIKALTYSGTYPSSTFQILSTAQGSASPKTGDESNLGLWAAFLLLSGTAVVVLVPKLRKHDF